MSELYGIFFEEAEELLAELQNIGAGVMLIRSRLLKSVRR